MTRWLVTGAGGLLGSEVVRLLGPGADVRALARGDLDVTDPAAVEAAVAGSAVVVNAAAWTAVDAAEDHQDAAAAVNALGPGHLSRACAAHGARLVHVSTDYVFDGRADVPYREDQPAAPRTAYGRTKLAGEQAVRAGGAHAWVLRTAWVYGRGRGFPATIRGVARRGGPLDVVHDEVGQPTWVRDLAQRVLDVVRHDVPPGTYHATNAGQVSRDELAREVLRLVGEDPSRVRPVPSSAIARPAPRPAYSVLAHDGWRATELAPLRPWDEALVEAARAGELEPVSR